MENTQITDDEVIKTVTESIKLIKNTKGYNYEIRIMPLDRVVNQLTELDVDRLSKLNKQLEAEYGSKEN